MSLIYFLHDDLYFYNDSEYLATVVAHPEHPRPAAWRATRDPKGQFPDQCFVCAFEILSEASFHITTTVANFMR